MTARVYSLQLEKARLKGADKGAYRQPQEGGKDIDRMGHRAHSLRPVECPRNHDDAACLFSTVDADLGRYLSQLPAHALQGAAAYMASVAAATAWSALILHQTERLLRHADSLLAAGDHLGSRSQSCRTERVGESFGPKRTS